MLFVVPAGIIEVRFPDPGMAVHTLLVFFLGILGSRSRKWLKQKSHNPGYRQSS